MRFFELVPPSTSYRPDIDGLRAIAVLSVVFFHAFPEIVVGGFVGVDVFFVISGYLISSIILIEIYKSDFSLFRFYFRRVRRIFPALSVVFIFCIVFGWVSLLSSEYQQLGKHIAAGAGFVANLVLWNESGYFDSAAELKPLLHLWSLGIEEQFYVFWPILLLFTFRLRFNFWIPSVFLLLLSFFLNLKGVSKNPIAIFYSPHTRIWELVFGACLARLDLYRSASGVGVSTWFKVCLAGIGISFNRNYFEKYGSSVVSFLGLLFLIFGVFFINKKLEFPGGWALIPVLGAGFIIVAGRAAFFNRYILSRNLFVWVGLISFPLYLWHWPILSFAKIIVGESIDLKIKISLLIISFVLSWLTFKFVESPIRFGRLKNLSSWFFVFLMVTIGAIGFLVYSLQGLDSRFRDKSELRQLLSNPLPLVDDYSCDRQISDFNNLTFDGGCKLSKDSLPTLMFIGDSHTAHYRNAIWDRFTTDTVLMLVQTSCLPFSSNDFLNNSCKDKYDATLRFIERNKTIETVIVSGYWSYLMSGGFGIEASNWRQAKSIDDNRAESFKENGEKFILSVIRSGKRLVFMKDIPDLNFDIKKCFDDRPFRFSEMNGLMHDCTMNSDEYFLRIKPYDKIVDELLSKFPQVIVYDPRNTFCKDNICRAGNSEVPYYHNGDHVNRIGAGLVFDDFLNNLTVDF